MILRCTAGREGKLLSFLRRELEMSSGLVSRLKFKNAYFVDGEPAYTDRKILPGQEITVVIEETPQEEFEAEHEPIRVLYEDESLLFVDKPAGLVVHPTWNRLTGTLLNRVKGYYEETGQHCAIHPVNRLDRDTMGIVLLAKNSHVHARLYEMQLAGKFQKTYRALCMGRPPKDEGVIDLPIRRCEGYTILREIHPEGQVARTEYRLVEERDGVSLVELSPITGRTHQLRLHCLAGSFPMLGDPQYCTEESRALSEKLGLVGQQLAAVRLELTHPMTEKPVSVTSFSQIFLPEG